MLKRYLNNIQLVLSDLISMVLQSFLMFNFSVKDNKEILKKFNELENKILEENDEITEVKLIPVWARIINIFILGNHFFIASLISKISQ